MKNILFDTSYLNMVKEGAVNIEGSFPTSKCARLVQDTFLDELFFDRDGCWYERIEASEFFRKNFLQILDEFSIILNEYTKNSERSLAISNERNEEVLRFLSGESSDENRENSYKDFRKRRKESNREEWQKKYYGLKKWTLEITSRKKSTDEISTFDFSSDLE